MARDGLTIHHNLRIRFLDSSSFSSRDFCVGRLKSGALVKIRSFRLALFRRISASLSASVDDDAAFSCVIVTSLQSEEFMTRPQGEWFKFFVEQDPWMQIFFTVSAYFLECGCVRARQYRKIQFIEYIRLCSLSYIRWYCDELGIAGKTTFLPHKNAT